MILRDLAIERDGVGDFDFRDFLNRINDQVFSDKQNAPLMMRMQILESFLDLPKYPRGYGTKEKLGPPDYAWRGYKPGPDFLVGQPGQLTIIDLTDPVVDPDTACTLFNICLSIFISQTKCSKIVALDEAHNYMGEGSSNAVKEFTDKLLKTIREQRHQATRVVIATQEPTINTQLIDLCSITMVHRCTSPAWFAVLKKHVAALSVHENNADGEKLDDGHLFGMIVRLKLGESLLFCPTAAVGVEDGEILRMNTGFRKFKTRLRITADGGTTKTADEL